MITFRRILPEDNVSIAAVIRNALTEFGVDRPGTVFTDPTTDALFELFQTSGSTYWVALENGKVVGGCGVFPTIGLPEGCAELVKLYVDSTQRGNGIGYKLMELSIQSANDMGYTSLYLETLPELSKAVTLYKRLGFTSLDRPLGESGHFACDIWMLKKI